jgi:hypothetical protein
MAHMINTVYLADRYNREAAERGEADYIKGQHTNPYPRSSWHIPFDHMAWQEGHDSQAAK